MRYDIVKIAVNGTWRDMLVVSSDAPISVVDPRKIIQQLDQIEITYHTDGLFRALVDAGRYIHWYLVTNTSKTYRSEYVAELQAERDELAAAFEIALGEEAAHEDA